MNQLIIGLSKDKKGLLVRVANMEKTNYWHVHSDEMTPYQKKVHKKLIAEPQADEPDCWTIPPKTREGGVNE